MTRRRVTTNCKPRPNGETYEYFSRKQLLTSGELRFFRQGLLPAIENRYHAAPKVRLADVIGCTGSSRSTAFRKIQSKHLDFVLMTRKSCRIVAAIELNDASHDCVVRQRRDAFVADALHGAGIPLVVVPVFQKYEPRIIRNYIQRAIRNAKPADAN